MDVTLRILGHGQHQYSPQVRLDDGEHQLLAKLESINDQEFESKLGALETLRHGSLRIDTVAQKGDSYELPSVEYKIFYGGEQVERMEQKGFFDDAKTAFFSFDFKFCPRSPWC